MMSTCKVKQAAIGFWNTERYDSRCTGGERNHKILYSSPVAYPLGLEG